MADEGEVFEIFQQDQKALAPHHGGNLRAPDGELAVHYAREFYGRRQESHRLWIIPRSALWEIADTGAAQIDVRPLAGVDVTSSDRRQVFAVFGQGQAGRPLVWRHDLAEMSLPEAARAATHRVQNTGETCLRLWLCPRRAIVELTSQDLLQPPLDRSYRRLDGYNIREKLRAARQRAQSQGGAKLP
jgi:hypothetical protein